MTAHEHSVLLQDILREFGALPGLRLWKQASGVALSLDGERKIKYGVNGWADIGGIMHGNGRVIQIEVKTGTATQTKEQKRWQAMIEAHGGLYVLARSVDDVRRALDCE